MIPWLRWAAVSMAVLALSACSGGGDDKTAAAPEPSSRTLAQTLGADGDHAALNGVVTNAGLEPVLNGVGPYTVFAPPNAAVDGAGDLRTEAMRAQGAALTRAHIVPGALTRADIQAALARGGRVQMRTMADGMLTLTQQGQAILVTAADGAQARLTGQEALTSNGVIQPVTDLLVKTEPGS